MSSKSCIFVATHPRACSTAFERVFMARSDILECIHEPFGDAFYYGPERLSPRFESDPETRKMSGFSASTYATILTHIADTIAANPTKRIFIKDIIHYLSPPSGQPASIAPSLSPIPSNLSSLLNLSPPNTTLNGDGVGNAKEKIPNPTVIPLALLAPFHFTFLIRHPRRAIPSYYRCTIPPLSEVTGFEYFMPEEAGYRELRVIFDYLRNTGVIGPDIAGHSQYLNLNGDDAKPNGHTNGHTNGNTNGTGNRPGQVKITVVDADDLLDNPEAVIRAYCKEVDIEFDSGMLNWNEDTNAVAKEKFEKWRGFHEDAIGSSSLKPREGGRKEKTREQEDEEWRTKYGEEGAKLIRKTVDECVDDYEYLKTFCMKF